MLSDKQQDAAISLVAQIIKLFINLEKTEQVGVPEIAVVASACVNMMCKQKAKQMARIAAVQHGDRGLLAMLDSTRGQKIVDDNLAQLDDMGIALCHALDRFQADDETMASAMEQMKSDGDFSQSEHDQALAKAKSFLDDIQRQAKAETAPRRKNP